MNKRNKSGVTGVYYDQPSNRFRSFVCIRGKKVQLGYFTSMYEAQVAREKALELANFQKFYDPSSPYDLAIPRYIQSRYAPNSPLEDLSDSLIYAFIVYSYGLGQSFLTFAINQVLQDAQSQTKRTVPKVFHKIVKGVFQQLDSEDNRILAEYLNGFSIYEIATKHRIAPTYASLKINEARKMLERRMKYVKIPKND